jgi:hypothetical protein
MMVPDERDQIGKWGDTGAQAVFPQSSAGRNTVGVNQESQSVDDMNIRL